MTTEMMAIRAVEVFFLTAWVFGFWLCFTKTRRAYLLGAYVGLSVTWLWDWLFAYHLWNMTFAHETIIMLTWAGHGEALWAPLSYGAFFGIAMYFWMRHEPAIVRTFGIWRYPLIFPTMFIANLIFEGLIIQFTNCNTYHLPEQFLVINIPWMHFVTTGGMAFGVIILNSTALSVFKEAGWEEFLSATSGPLSKGWRAKLFWIGVCLPQAAFFFSLLAGMYLYDAMGLLQK